MRNLKKILALVLALIMSLSLMATAGATDFKDDADVSDTYRQAVEVLSELGVFNGDQNGQFNPGQPIKRSEVAAILYRIATGDIGLEGNKTYAPYNQFPDVTAEDWYAGYVTYCANAGYIKGRNTGKFDAKDDVTGYEVLAMILRAVGYDKNNEFVGRDWQLNTASIAREKGVLANVLEDPAVRLSEPATREVVAELLFRASLLPQVTWNAATLSYREEGETLAYENLGMEQIEGIVVANQWADLRYDYIDVDADETVLETANGERTLAVGTDLTDIGESRYAYVVGTKVLGQLENTGKNVTKDCVELDPQGKATSVGALAGSLSTKDAEYYINFSDLSYNKSEYRIEYSVSFRNDDAKEWFEDNYLGQTRGQDDVELEKYVPYYNDLWGYTTVNKLNDTGAGSYCDDGKGNAVDDGTYNYLGRTFSRVIPAREDITWLDIAIMQGIFASAASFDGEHKDFNALSKDIVHTGYVYAGTKSNPNTADRKDDLSDDYTYQKFADEYIGIAADAYFTGTTNGEWLKIIDNDNDGAAEYIFDTVYDLVEVDSYNDRTGAYTFTGTADSDDAVCRDSEYEFAVGDMLLGAWIDNQYVVEKAQSEVVVIEKYSWKDVSVTTKDGAVLYESGAGIDNTTGYADRISEMSYGVEYEVFYDHYGFIRAYRPVSSERSYGLLTDLYLTNHRNTHYIDDQTATVELSFVDENGKLDIHEYDVAGHSKTTPNVFVGVQQDVYNHHDGTALNDKDNLQRAMAHLGMRTDNDVLRATPTRNSSNNEYGGSYLGEEFDYDHTDNILNEDIDGDGDYDVRKQAGTSNIFNDGYAENTNIDFSWTNVARYSFNEDGTVNLNTASEYAYDKAGNQLFYWNGSSDAEKKDNWVVGGASGTRAAWLEAYAETTGGKVTDQAVIDAVEENLVPVYAVDYVMLDTATLANGAASVNSGSYRFAIDPIYANNTGNLYNWHVNAVSDTVFYIVTPKNIYPIVGYKNLPTIAKSDIHAMYAVAQNIGWDNDLKDYWVADVIVIETTDELDGAYGHMIYNVYDNYRSGQQRAIIHELEAIDCTTGQLVNVIVDSSWTQPYSNGFYLLSDAETAEDGTVTATGMISVETDKKENNNKYADYGIYAGEVVRSSDIESRGSYIEVFDATNDENVEGDEIRVELAGAPWYSVHGTAAEAAKPAGRLTATQLADRDYSGVQPNRDEVVYVKYGGKVVFIIDTTFGYPNSWVAPAYLNDGTWRVYTAGDVYDTAMIEQTGPRDAGRIVFDTNFAEYVDAAGKVQKFPVPTSLDFGTITTDGSGVQSTSIAYSSLKVDNKALVIPDGYLLTGAKSANESKYTVAWDGNTSHEITVTGVGKYDLKDGVTIELIFEADKSDMTATPAHLPIIANAEEESTPLPKTDYSIDAIERVSGPERAVIEDPVPGDTVNLYFTVKTGYTVKSVTINAPASMKGDLPVHTKLGTIGYSTVAGTQYYITFVLPAEVIDLTINAENTTGNVMISVPENTTLAGANHSGSGNVAAIAKDDALNGKILKLLQSGNYDLPATVTVKVGSHELVSGTDYTYVASTGLITFDSTAGKADGAIVIEGEAKAQTVKLNLSGTGLTETNVVVKQDGAPIDRDVGNSLTWTLQKGVDAIVEITPAADANKRVSAVTDSNSNLSFKDDGTTGDATANDGTYTAELTNPTDATTSAIVVTQVDTVELTLNLVTTAAAGATVDVTQTGGKVNEVTPNVKYIVDKDVAATITVVPSTGNQILGDITVAKTAGTATGTATGAAYTVTPTDNSAYTITPTYKTKVAVSVAVSDKITATGISDDGYVYLESNGKATVTVTINKDAFEIDTDDNTNYRASFTVTVGAGYQATGASGWDCDPGDNGAFTFTTADGTTSQPGGDTPVTVTIEAEP